MPNLEEKLRYHSNRNNIMEQGLNALHQSLEERRARLVQRQNNLRRGMQELGARLDQGEKMSNAINQKSGTQNVSAPYSVRLEQENIDDTLAKTMDAISGMAEGLADNSLLEILEARLQAELGEKTGSEVYAYMKQTVSRTLVSIQQEYRTLQSSKEAGVAEYEKTMEPNRQRQEKLHASEQIFDEVEQWEHRNWNKCTRKIQIPSLPQPVVEPADGSEQYLERLMAAFDQLNDSAKDQQKAEQQLEEMERQIALLEGQLADYSKRVDAAIKDYEALAGAQGIAVPAGSQEMTEQYAAYRMKISALLSRASAMQQAISQAVEEQKSEDTQAKVIAYCLLSEAATIQEQEEQDLFIYDTGAVIDNVKAVTVLKKERRAQTRGKMAADLKAKGWAVLEDRDIQKMMAEMEAEEEKERIETAQQAVKKGLLEEANTRLEQKETDQYRLIYEKYLEAGIPEHLSVMREISNKMKQININLPEVENVSENDQVNPFSALESGALSTDGVEDIRNRIFRSPGDRLDVSNQEVKQPGTLLTVDEKQKLDEKMEAEADKTVQAIVQNFQSDVEKLNIREVFDTPTRNRAAEDYTCMKASAALQNEICELHYSKKRWEEDSPEYSAFLAAADQYAWVENAFRTDDFSVCPRSEVAQYAVEDAKQKLLDKAVQYLAVRKKLQPEAILKMNQEELATLLSDSKGVAGRRLNAAIHIIDILHIQPETRLKFDTVDALKIFSSKFRTCLIEGLRSFHENHRKMNNLYEEAYYQDNVQHLNHTLMKYGRFYSRTDEIKAYMAKTYETLYKLSRSEEPLTSDDWKQAIFCTARVYVFHLMNQDPENNRNMGPKEMELAAKNLVERSYNVREKSQNGFRTFVKEFLNNKADIAAVQKHVEQSDILNTVAMKDGHLATLEHKRDLEKVNPVK